MTDKDDPLRVTVEWNGIERRRPLQKSSSGNGAEGNGTLTGREPAIADHAPAGFCSLGRLILDTFDRGVIAIDASGAVIDANLHARRVLDGKEAIRVRNGRLEFVDPCVDDQLTRLLAMLSLTSTAPHGFVAHLNHCISNGRLEFVDPCVDDQLTRLLAVLSSASTAPHGFVAHLNHCNVSRPPRVL